MFDKRRTDAKIKKYKKVNSSICNCPYSKSFDTYFMDDIWCKGKTKEITPKKPCRIKNRISDNFFRSGFRQDSQPLKI